MERTERLHRLAAVNAAPTYEAEQAALIGAPGVDLRYDLPRDRGELWRIHTHDMDREDYDALNTIAQQHHLAWERGAGAYYATAQQVNAVLVALGAEGFVVAVDP